jgi:hypothetical protein
MKSGGQAGYGSFVQPVEPPPAEKTAEMGRYVKQYQVPCWQLGCCRAAAHFKDTILCATSLLAQLCNLASRDALNAGDILMAIVCSQGGLPDYNLFFLVGKLILKPKGAVLCHAYLNDSGTTVSLFENEDGDPHFKFEWAHALCSELLSTSDMDSLRLSLAVLDHTPVTVHEMRLTASVAEMDLRALTLGCIHVLRCSLREPVEF